MQASNLAQAGHAFFALTLSMNMHGRAAAMVTPIGDKKTLFPPESAMSSSGAPDEAGPRAAARERTMEAREAAGSAANAKVCVLASVAEGGPSATLPASWSVDLEISAPLGMGRRPKHIYTLTLRSTTRGHPVLSLDRNVTAVTAI